MDDNLLNELRDIFRYRDRLNDELRLLHQDSTDLAPEDPYDSDEIPSE